MRVLFSTCSPAGYMAPPSLGDEQVNCGPDWKDEQDAAGVWRSFNTPVGDYDLANVAAKLGAAQRPDLVVCLVDASWRNTPRGLAAFKCPRILLVADTHHLRQPIVGMLRYATSEPFTRIVLLYARHHAEIFRSAGIRNLFWFPGLTFPHSDAVVHASRLLDPQRSVRLAFVGQAGAIHARRARLLNSLERSGVAVDRQQISQSATLKFYGSSLLAFNCSLNGDLNLRLFEMLAGGAALLTDRLSPDSGLPALLEEGRQFLAYGSPNELVECASEALRQQSTTLQIGRAGAAWFDANFSAACRRNRFRRLAVDGIAHDQFAFSSGEATRVFFSAAPDRLVRSAVVYERVQELHRKKETVTIALSPTVPPELQRFFATLPRVQCVHGPAQVADLAIATLADTDLPATAASRAWWSDAKPSDVPAILAQHGDRAGVCVDPKTAYFRKTQRQPSANEQKYVLVYTDDPDSGGVAQYNHTLLMALVQAGYRVGCAQSRAENPLIAEQRAAGVSHHWIDYHTGKEFVRTLCDTDTAEDIFCTDAPDLVVFSDCCPVSNMAAREVALRHNIPYVVVVGFVGEYLAKNFAQFLPALARQYARAGSIVAVSENNRELLVRLFGAPLERCEVIHYGRPDRYFEPNDPAVRRRLRSERGIPDDAVVCLTTARLTVMKGYQHQLAAIKLLRGTSAARQLHFIWAGDGELRAELEKEIARNGLEKRVHLLGHRWDVVDWYDAADIFVLPSHLEGMPLSIMEAMAKGLPVIASAVSGIPEELGDSGLLLSNPVVDPVLAVRQLADALAGLAADSNLRAAKARLGRARAGQMFRLDTMRQRTLRLLERSLLETCSI